MDDVNKEYDKIVDKYTVDTNKIKYESIADDYKAKIRKMKELEKKIEEEKLAK